MGKELERKFIKFNKSRKLTKKISLMTRRLGYKTNLPFYRWLFITTRPEFWLLKTIGLLEKKKVGSFSKDRINELQADWLIEIGEAE